MKYEIARKSSRNFSLPILGLGTWTMGGNRFDRDAISHQSDIQAVKRAIDAGITHLDTAEIYSDGGAEEVVGEAIKNWDRTKLFITSKVSGNHLGYDEIIKACRDSLARLKIKKLDLYLVHWPNPVFPIKDTMRAMDSLLESGLIANIGVSNFDPSDLEEAQSHAKHKIVNNQVHYNLQARGHEKTGTFDYCREHDILVTAYRPLARGEFAESEILQKIGKKYQKTALAVALNWVLHKDNIVAIMKTSNPEHLQENLTALGWRLDAEDEKYLDEHFPVGATKGVGAEP